jgi:hypothetical protein
MKLRNRRFPGARMFVFPVLAILAGCASPYDPIDLGLVADARLALLQQRPPPEAVDEGIEPYSPEERPRKSVIVAELLAIFPGFFWHGLGHQYAGDTKTAKEIRGVGEWGYILTAIGGGLVVGGYFLDQSDDKWDPYALSLYISGGITGGVGGAFFLTAWFYDMIDTPRAIESGGRPPAKSLFGGKASDEEDRL